MIKGNSVMQLTTKQLKQIIKEELESFMEQRYDEIELTPAQEIKHRRILNQIVRGKIDGSQDEQVQTAIKDAIQEFNECVEKDNLPDEEKDKLDIFSGESEDCFDFAAELAEIILKKYS